MTEPHSPAPYSINPLAEAFLRSPRALYASLVVRIAQYDFRPKVIVWREEIIYGVELLDAYAEAGVEPLYKHLPNEADPLVSLVGEAIPYQTMDNNGRAVSAYLLSRWSTRGRPRAERENYENLRIISQQEAAGIYGVRLRLVSYASQVLSEDSKAVAALQQAVKGWAIKASAAAKVLDRPPMVQERAVDLVLGGKVRSVGQAVAQIEREIAQQERAKNREAAMSHPIMDVVALHQAGVEDLHAIVPAGSVDAIITKIAHTESVVVVCRQLADFAVHALTDSGVLVVIGIGQDLQMILTGLFEPRLPLIDELDLVFDGPPLKIPDLQHDIEVSRLPVLVLAKESFRPKGLKTL